MKENLEGRFGQTSLYQFVVRDILLAVARKIPRP